MTLFRSSAIVAVFGLVACSCQKSKPPADMTLTRAEDGPAAAPNVLSTAYNLGDVDYATVPSVLLSERSKSPSIQYLEQKTLRGNVALANATVSLPAPANLWITASVESTIGYQSKDTVLVRMSVTADTRKEPLVTKNFVFSGKGLTTNPERVEIDLMPFLVPVPSTVLLQSRLEIVWFPDTDAATINPDTADVSKGQRLEKLSNPLRINFK